MDQCTLRGVRNSIRNKVLEDAKWARSLKNHYKLRNPALAACSSSSFSTSPPLWAAEFFLFTCFREVPWGLCIGTKSWKPDWLLAEAVPTDPVKVLNVQGIKEDDAEHVDEGLMLRTEEYPEEKVSGSWLWQLLLLSFSASQKLSSSLDRALQCSCLLSSLGNSSLMDIIDARETQEKKSDITVSHFRGFK